MLHRRSTTFFLPADHYVYQQHLGCTSTDAGCLKLWDIPGRKTSAYRQVGNAFPPPVAEAVGRSIASALALADDVAAARTVSDLATHRTALSGAAQDDMRVPDSQAERSATG